MSAQQAWDGFVADHAPQPKEVQWIEIARASNALEAVCLGCGDQIPEPYRALLSNAASVLLRLKEAK